MTEEHRPYAELRRYPQHGKTTITIECPWCGEHFNAYVWSLAGSGKKCPACGSMHHYYTGATEPPKKKNI